MQDHPHKPGWIGLSTSISFIVKSKRVLSWSLALTVLTIIVTWAVFSLGSYYLDMLYLDLFPDRVQPEGWWQFVKDKFWSVVALFFRIGTTIACFYLSFLVAYCITCPGYFFLSHAAEKIYAGKNFDPDAAFTLKGALVDLWEGVKIAVLGVVVTFFTLWLNFIPVVGQGALLLVYVFYSTLIFIDYPGITAQMESWQKLTWIREHNIVAVRIGLVPALVSLIPLINIFGMAIIFPVMTVHATLNFATIEMFNKQS